MKVVFSDAARRGLRDIAKWIARHNKSRALSFTRELRAKAVELGRMHAMFPMVPRFEQAGIRRRTVGNYLIFFRVDPDHVVIIDIMHGARDYAAILSVRPEGP